MGIYWFMNLLATGPLAGEGHLEVFSARTACPVCGAENLHARCPHDASFVADVSTDEVVALAHRAFSGGRAA